MLNTNDSCVSQWGDFRLFTIRNRHGVEVDISDLGASVINFFVHDRFHRKTNITLGYHRPEDYIAGQAFIGGVVGPWANRIESGQYKVDNQTVQLAQNEGSNHLHGASVALHLKRWQVVMQAEQGITLKTRVVKGEAGYPANIDISVTYRLTENNELSIHYNVEPDAVVPLNMTHHAYFNLNGGVENILSHILTIDADEYWKIDQNSIPVLRQCVANSAMDFRQPKRIGAAKALGDEQVEKVNGFDHCWCLNGDGLRPVAWLYDNSTGIALEVSTDQPGLQFYSGNALDEPKGREGHYRQYAGLCLETQAYPNQVNMADAKSVLYGPNKTYTHTAIYQVMVE